MVFKFMDPYKFRWALVEKIIIRKDSCTLMSIAALFIITKTWSNGGTNKEDVVDIYSEILLNHRKEVMPFAITWMKLEGIILSKVSQREKDKYCVVSLVCEIKKPQTHKNGEQIGDYQRQRVEGWGKGMKVFKRWLKGKESACQCRRCRRSGFNPWVQKIPLSREWQLTPVFWPRKFHGQSMRSQSQTRLSDFHFHK